MSFPISNAVFIWQDPIIDVLGTPPGSPSVGDRYIVGPNATGAWVGQSNTIATWNGSAWTFETPQFGWIVNATNSPFTNVFIYYFFYPDQWSLIGNVKESSNQIPGKFITIPGLPQPPGPQGAPGQPGPAGSVGTRGNPGPKGDQGIQGIKGDRGIPGPKGDSGEQGPKGNDGAAGSQGPAGSPGLVWRGIWSNSTTYSINDAVFRNGNSYVASAAGTNHDPISSPAFWGFLTEGAYGGAITIDSLFDTGTSNADPGSGKWRLSNGTQTTALALYIDLTSNDGIAIAAILDSLNNSTSATKATLRIHNRFDVTKFLIFNVTNVITHTGYRELTIASGIGSTSSPFNASDEALLSFSVTGNAGQDAIPILLPNTTAQGRLAPTGTITNLVTIPTTAFAESLATFRNEGTAGNWYIAFNNLFGFSTSLYHAKLGPGDAINGTMGEAFTEENPPVGIIKAFHDNPTAVGADALGWYVNWNDGTSPLAGPIGLTGMYGGPITLDYRINTASQANTDPGAGFFKLNNATQNIPTALYINTTSNDGVNATSILDGLFTSISGNVLIRIVDKSDPTKFLLFNATGETVHTGYREYALVTPATAFSTANPFTNNEELLLSIGYVGNVFPRQSVTLVTGVLTPSQTETGSITMAKTVAIGKVVSSDFCRIRLYSTSAARTADAARPPTTVPPINTQHGVIMDLVTAVSADLTWIMSPLAYGANEDTSPVSPVLYYSVQNRSASTEALTITFTFTSEEY